MGREVVSEGLLLANVGECVEISDGLDGKRRSNVGQCQGG